MLIKLKSLFVARNNLPLFLLSTCLLLGACSSDENAAAVESTQDVQVVTITQETATAPDAATNPLRDVYFGETHMHTAYSLDAYIGGTRLTPADAYRFVRGETVTVNGKPYTRKRPLDFVAVSDHAEYIGEMYSTMVEGAPGHDQDLLKQWRTQRRQPASQRHLPR